MKIETNPLDISLPQNDRVRGLKANSQPPSRLESTRSSGDRVSLGSSGLFALARAAGADDREATVQRLRALVQSGQYQVDTTALSQSLLQSAQLGD